MNDSLERKSFLRRQWEAYKLVDETVRNKSLLEDFIASDPVNGPIVKASQDTRGKAHIATGIIIFGTCWRYGWKHRTRIANDVVQLVAMIALPPLAARVTLDFGISTYLIRNKDQRDAYVEFNEWLKKRA
ncbi:hypothetical protein ACS0TY_020139 [Phlomoides rotata]